MHKSVGLASWKIVFSSAWKNMRGLTLPNDMWKLGNSHWKQQCLWADSRKPKARMLSLSLKSMFIKLVIALQVEKSARDWHLLVCFPSDRFHLCQPVCRNSQRVPVELSVFVPEQSNRRATKYFSATLPLLFSHTH